MCLERHIKLLLERYARAPRPGEVLLAELRRPDVDEAGRIVVRAAALSDVATYAPRFDHLMTRGYAWLNLSYHGLLDGRPRVTVEYPGSG